MSSSTTGLRGGVLGGGAAAGGGTTLALSVVLAVLALPFTFGAGFAFGRLKEAAGFL
jgi:hypothetical protein